MQARAQGVRRVRRHVSLGLCYTVLRRLVAVRTVSQKVPRCYCERSTDNASGRSSSTSAGVATDQGRPGSHRRGSRAAISSSVRVRRRRDRAARHRRRGGVRHPLAGGGAVKPLIVGESPGGEDGVGQVAFRDSSSSRRLKLLVARGDWRRDLDAVNLVDRYLPRGEPWPSAEARGAADAMVRASPWFRSGRVAFLAGRKVSKAFGGPRWYFIPTEASRLVGGRRRRYMLVSIPHPSGRCRWWNSPRNREYAEYWFKKILEQYSTP